MSEHEDGVPDPEETFENGWTVTGKVQVSAAQEDGFPVVWLDFGDAGTAALCAREWRILEAAWHRAGELADKHNGAREEAREVEEEMSRD